MTHPIIVEKSRLEDGAVVLQFKAGWTLRAIVRMADLILFAAVVAK